MQVVVAGDSRRAWDVVRRLQEMQCDGLLDSMETTLNTETGVCSVVAKVEK